jgi:iron complex outermembrane receptor protein
VNNLGDVRPDRIKQSATVNVYPLTGGTAAGEVYPRNGGPFGINGRFMYLRLTADF